MADQLIRYPEHKYMHYRSDATTSHTSWFWEAYREMRHLFKHGWYVLFLDGRLFDVSLKPYKMKYSSPFYIPYTETVHQVYDGDIEFQDLIQIRHQKKAIAPAIVDKVKAMLAEIEKETGTQFNLTLDVVGRYESKKIELERSSYTIYATLPRFEYLKGTYTSTEQMMEKFIRHAFQPYVADLRCTKSNWEWKCKYCESWENSVIYGDIRCGKCSLDEGVRIDIPSFSVDSGQIYMGGGGTLSIVTIVGLIKTNS